MLYNIYSKYYLQRGEREREREQEVDQYYTGIQRRQSNTLYRPRKQKEKENV